MHIKAVLTGVLRVAVALPFILLGSFIFWQSAPFGLFILTLSAGLALAGKGNRLIWLLLLLSLAAVLAVLAMFNPFTRAGLDGSPFVGAVLCGLMPLIPAFILWTAHALRRHRQPPPISDQST